jgi:lysophospholipase L1-like esterase
MKKIIEKLEAKTPVTIVAVGDSNNVICGHTKGHFNWFHHLHLGLCETFGDGFIYMINSAVCSNTVAMQLQRMEQDILRWKPDLVIAAFGINDQGMGLDRIGEFRENYREFIRQVQGCGAELLFRTPAPKVFGSGYGDGLPPSAKPGEPWAGEGGVIGAYAQAIVELGRESDSAVCDHYSAWMKQKLPAMNKFYSYQGLSCRYKDTLHLNEQGHLAMFRELAPLFGMPTRFTYEETF